MYEELIRRHKPRGWRVSYTKSKTKIADAAEANYRKRKRELKEVAYCLPNQRRIVSPIVHGPFTLFILLHEFGHVHLRHWDKGQSVSHREEYEAERWAAEIMRQEGIKVARASIVLAKHYIRECIKADMAKEIPIQVHVARWAAP